MRRAILFLAVLAAGASGCYSKPSCPQGGTLTLYWQPPQGGFTTATGQLLGCDAAGVATVDVTIDGTPAGTFNCHGPSADGIQLTGFGDQTVTIQLDAFDASNRDLYQEVIQNQNTAFCADTLVDANLSALTGDMTVYTSFGPYTTCAQAGIASITYSLYDANGAVYSSATVPCQDPSPGFQIPSVDLGFQYTFRFIQALDASGYAHYDLCGEGVNFNNLNPIALPLQPIVNGVTCP